MSFPTNPALGQTFTDATGTTHVCVVGGVQPAWAKQDPTMSTVAAAAAAGTDSLGNAVAVGDQVVTLNDGSTINLNALGGAGVVNAAAGTVVPSPGLVLSDTCELYANCTGAAVTLTGTDNAALAGDGLTAQAGGGALTAVTLAPNGTDLRVSVTVDGTTLNGDLAFATLANSLYGDLFPVDAAGVLTNDGAGNLTWAAAGGGDDDITAVTVTTDATNMTVTVTEGATVQNGTIALATLATAVLGAGQLEDFSDVPAYPNDGNAYELTEQNGVLTWQLTEDIAAATAAGTDTLGNAIAVGEQVLTLSNGDSVNLDALGGAGGPPSGAAGGALAGSYPNPTLASPSDVAAAAAAGTDTLGNAIAVGEQVLTTNSGDTVNLDALGGAGGPPSGAAGGALAGSYPNPTLASPSDVAAAAAAGTDTLGNAIAVGENVLTTNSGDTVNLDALGGGDTSIITEAAATGTLTHSDGAATPTTTDLLRNGNVATLAALSAIDPTTAPPMTVIGVDETEKAYANLDLDGAGRQWVQITPDGGGQSFATNFARLEQFNLPIPENVETQMNAATVTESILNNTTISGAGVVTIGVDDEGVYLVNSAIVIANGIRTTRASVLRNGVFVDSVTTRNATNLIGQEGPQISSILRLVAGDVVEGRYYQGNTAGTTINCNAYLAFTKISNL